MLYDLQNKNVLSLRLKVWVLLVWRTVSGRVFQDLAAAMLKARSPSLSLDRGKKRSKFDTDLRTVDPVDSTETGCSKAEIYDGALPLRARWTRKQIGYEKTVNRMVTISFRLYVIYSVACHLFYYVITQHILNL